MLKKKKIPKFRRPNYGRTKRSRIKDNWRKPRGVDNKKRVYKKFMGCSPAVGYRQDKRIRGMHPSGMREILVENLQQLDGAKDVLVRIAGGVGKKLKAKLVAKAQQLKLRVVNP